MPVTIASIITLLPTSAELLSLPCIALISVASAPQIPSSTAGSSGTSTTSPPPSVLNVPAGNGVAASVLVVEPSSASTPL
nr:hypothetical protein [Alteromonas sp. KUL17]